MQFTDVLWHKWLRQPYQLHAQIDRGEKDMRTIVLLHGIASSGAIWKSVANAPELSNWRVLAYDLLGFGASPKPGWSAYDVEAQTRNLYASLKADKANFPVVLVGHSMGSLVAAHFASRYPKLVKRLVLYEPPLFNDLPDYRSHSRRRKIYFSIFQRITESPAMVLAYARFAGKVATKLAGFALDESTWVPFERSLRNTIMNQGTYNELRALKIRTDIIYGRFDIVVTQADVRKMFAANKHITFHTTTDMHGISRMSSAYLVKLVMGTSTRKVRKKPAMLVRKGRRAHTKNIQPAKSRKG